MTIIPILLVSAAISGFVATFIHRSKSDTIQKYSARVMQLISQLDHEAVQQKDAQSLNTLNNLKALTIDAQPDVAKKMSWQKHYAFKFGIPLFIVPTILGVGLILYIGDYQPTYNTLTAIVIGLVTLLVGILVATYLTKSYQSSATFPQLLTDNDFLDLSKIVHSLRTKTVLEIIFWEITLCVYCALIEVMFYLAG